MVDQESSIVGLSVIIWRGLLVNYVKILRIVFFLTYNALSANVKRWWWLFPLLPLIQLHLFPLQIRQYLLLLNLNLFRDLPYIQQLLSLIQASLRSNAPSFLRWWWVIPVYEAFESRHLSLFGGATRRWSGFHLQGAFRDSCKTVVVIVSELFEFTLFISGLWLDSWGNWVFHWVYNSSLMILRREHHVILIQWHLRSHWISHI